MWLHLAGGFAAVSAENYAEINVFVVVVWGCQCEHYCNIVFLG